MSAIARDIHMPIRKCVATRLCGAIVPSALLALVLLLAGCISDPTLTSPPVVSAGAHGVLVVNEGVWKQDNSTLTFYNPDSGGPVQDYFAARNPGLRLGDLGNSIVTWKGRGYIAVSTSRAVEVIDLATGHSLGRVRLNAPNEPRMIAIIDSATAFVTTFADSVIRFNPMTLATTGSFAVGPAPEGIAYAAGHLFVANSGLGNLRRTEPGAGTISVLDPASGAELAMLPTGTNPLSVHYLPSRGRVYVLARPILPDTLGAVVEYDPASLREVRRWPVAGGYDMAVDDGRGIIYVMHGEGVARIDPSVAGDNVRGLVQLGEAGAMFYSIGVEPVSGDIYLGTTNGYSSVPAAVMIYDRAGAFKSRFPCGIYPGDFAFY
ncbi:MAG: beta-propeller repeat protein [Chlorobi bacterium]|nr:beta-propeller repeat protein [Chlorobiota bacterium]